MEPRPPIFPREPNFVASIHGGRSGTLPPGWDTIPNYRCRADLLQARKKAARPDGTFDLDGDGFVSQCDFKAASRFDLDKDGKLLGEEKQRALHWQKEDDPRALFYSQPPGKGPKLYFDVESSNNNMDEDSDAKTRSKLKAERKIENLTSLQKKYDEWKGKQASLIPPDIFPKSREGRGEGGNDLNATWSHITRSRRERSRKEAGLLAKTTEINPMRASLDPSLNYVVDPEFPSRNALMENRRHTLVEKNDSTLHETSKYFIPSHLRLKNREDSLHLLREKGMENGVSRQEFLQHRRMRHLEELETTFAGMREENSGKVIPIMSSEEEMKRAAFWTLQEGYQPNPTETSAKQLKQSRKFWKKPEFQDELDREGGFVGGEDQGEEGETKTRKQMYKSVSHLIHNAEGFEPPPIQLQQFAVGGQQPRRAKPPASSAIRTKLKFDDPISPNRRPNPIEERAAHAPLYSSFSADKIFNPKPIPLPDAQDGEGDGGGGKFGKRKQRKEAVVYGAPAPMVEVLSTYRPYTVCSLLETQTKVRSGGFQLAMSHG